jgi:hypothetical protein
MCGLDTVKHAMILQIQYTNPVGVVLTEGAGETIDPVAVGGMQGCGCHERLTHA